MERVRIIKELAQYAHPSWYYNILKSETESLSKLLEHYKKNEEIVIVGVDVGFEEDGVDITFKFN